MVSLCLAKSYQGTQFQFQEPFNPNATVGLSIDGKHLGTLNDGSFEEMGLADGDHQVLLEIQAPDTNPYVFRGIKCVERLVCRSTER